MIEVSSRADGRVLHLLLAKPKANILDSAMIRALSSALEESVNDETCLVVFEGQGDHFCFGASVEEHQPDQAAEMLQAFHGLFRQLADLAVPTCAVVRGQCLGGGLELASWCTWIVSTPEARFGQPEIRLAVFPPMASILIPWRAGGQTALDLCVSGRSIKAPEALAVGLINAVTEDPQVWWETLVEKHLSKTSASSLRFAELAARMDLMEAMEKRLPRLEALYLEGLMATPDAKEGIQAFLDRRNPVFTHKAPGHAPVGAQNQGI
jgi:cyclohexa-1,5-dienecarbonyl-CoA hydratase